METETDRQDWEKLSYGEKNRRLFLREKALLAGFPERGAISRAQYDRSLRDLIEKMGKKEEAPPPFDTRISPYSRKNPACPRTDKPGFFHMIAEYAEGALQYRPMSRAIWNAAPVAFVMFFGLRQSPSW